MTASFCNFQEIKLIDSYICDKVFLFGGQHLIKDSSRKSCKPRMIIRKTVKSLFYNILRIYYQTSAQTITYQPTCTSSKMA